MQILIVCPVPFQKPEQGEGAETVESLAARPTPSLGLSVLICKMGALRSPLAPSLRCPRVLVDEGLGMLSPGWGDGGWRGGAERVADDFRVCPQGQCSV